MSSLSELRTRVNRRTGHYLADEALTDLINEALTTLSLEAPWPWLDATATITWPSDGSSTTTMPFAWQAIRSVSVEGRREYRVRSQRDVDTYNEGQPGWSYGFAVHGRTITLAPAPTADAEVRIIGTRNDGPLVNDVDEPFLPDTYSDAVVQLACALVFDRHNDSARYARHRQAYDEWVMRLKKAVRAQERGPRTPRVRPGSVI